VGSTFGTCTTANQGTSITISGYTGSLLCPSNIATYCAQNKKCKDLCNNNGVCVKGNCFCTLNFYGE
jgi:hypothetical protein